MPDMAMIVVVGAVTPDTECTNCGIGVIIREMSRCQSVDMARSAICKQCQ